MRYRTIILAVLLTVAGIASGQTRRRVATQRTTTTTQQRQQTPQPQQSSDDEWKLLYDDTRKCRASNHYMVLNGPYIGLCASDGEEIIKPGIYDAVIDCNLSEYIFLLKNDLWGLYDLKQRKEVIPCKYEKDGILVQDLYKEDYEGHLAKTPVRTICVVSRDGKRGIYDVRQGREIVPCDYFGADVMETVDDMYLVWNLPSGKDVAEGSTALPYEGIYDARQQKQLTPLKYGMIYLNDFKKQDYCRVLSNRDPTIQHEEGIGIVDREGRELLEPKYTTLIRLDILNDKSTIYIVGEGGQRSGDFGDNYSELVSDRYALYDVKKKAFLTGFDYKRINPLKEGIVIWEGTQLTDSTSLEGLTSFCTKDDQWGYMDGYGKIVVPAQYEAVTEFEGGVAQVTKNGVTSMLANPLKGTVLTIAKGTESGKNIDSNIPETGRKDENLFAFVFANENYANLKGADYAINDGKVFYEYCRKTLGMVPDKQLHFYEDATYGNMASAVNTIKNVATVFEGEAKIIFYFAGLGATDSKTKERYLLLADGSLQTLGTTGYSVTELQNTLNSLNTVYTLVIIDAPFSNTDRNGNMLAESRGVQIAPKKIPVQGKTIFCVSSTDNETAYASKNYGHGLFTFGILQQLQQTKGEGTLKELIDNASEWTKKESMSEFKQTQTPQQTVSMEMEERWQQIKF